MYTAFLYLQTNRSNQEQEIVQVLLKFYTVAFLLCLYRDVYIHLFTDSGAPFEQGFLKQ